MGHRNIAEVDYECPHCGRTVHGFGFTLDVGPQWLRSVPLGGSLPWESNPPTGDWSTGGVGQCIYCHKWVDAICRFDGLILKAVDVVRSPTDQRWLGR